MEDRFKFRAWNKSLKIMLHDFEFLNTYTTLGKVAKDEEFVLMQSTGLKDRNGKLIYEGDIVQYDFGKNNSYINGIVKGKVFWNKTKWDIDCCFFDLEDYIPEIIGNIYENKELLKEQNNGNKGTED